MADLYSDYFYQQGMENHIEHLEEVGNSNAEYIIIN